MGNTNKKSRESKKGVWCYTGEKGWHLMKAKKAMWWLSKKPKTIITVDNSVHGGAA